MHTSKQNTTSTAVPTLSYANKTLSITKVKPTSTTDVTLPPTTDSSTSTVKVRFDDSSQLQKKKLSSDMPVSSFPTEQANRQKERKKAGIVFKKRKQHVEQHKDDVGENLSSIDVEPKELIHFQNLQNDEINRSTYAHSVLSHFLSGPPCFDTTDNHDIMTSGQAGAFVSTYLARHRDVVHVCEMFGGQAHTSTLCARLYNLKSGRIFELQCGVDLLTEKRRCEMWDYINLTRLSIIIMAPPCRGFSPWSFLEVIHPDAVAEARAQGIPLANLCAAVAKYQSDNSCHFVLEQPRQCTLFQIESWKKLTSRIHEAVYDQCRFGLVSSSGEPLKKPTRFVASHPILLEHVKNRFCNQ